MDTLDAKVRGAIQELIQQEVARQLGSKSVGTFTPPPRTE
eukprot:CAMPEP_0179053594 /NCGR_PEP_ID=MMETSP0796-20121207/22353_1 /TAXON_ID=73915 /ORGANISM="Pyrodinium bahamense, Strain pbaha01" /LENGTH=39 /DNA_ID= /DNA_START= /DNA_END= /DNA_ORIENTATION=